MRMLEDGITGRIGSYCDKQKQTHERFMHHESLNEEGDVVREIHSESNPGKDEFSFLAHSACSNERTPYI